MFTGLLARSNWQSKAGQLTLLKREQVGVAHLSLYERDTFLLAACEYTGLRSYTVNPDGSFNLIDTIKQGTDRYWRVYADSNWVYACCAGDGIRTYYMNESGFLTYEDVDDPGGAAFAYDAVRHDDFLMVAMGQSGIYSYNVNGSGILSPIDSDYQGTPHYSREYTAIAADSNYVYVGAEEDGIHTYSVNGIGLLTHESTVNNLAPGQAVYDIVLCNGVIYAAVETTGINTYTVGGGGVLTPVNTYLPDPGKIYKRIDCDSQLVFCAAETIVPSFLVLGGGNLQYQFLNVPATDANEILIGVSYPFVFEGEDLITSAGAIKSYFVERD
jgi:hypothetical protein